MLFKKGDYENALLRHHKALDIRLKCLGPAHVSVAETKYNMGQVLRKQGRLSEAMDMYQQAVDVLKRSL